MNTYPNKKTVPEYGTVKPSALFKQALAEDSNRLGDWVWYAEQLESDNERLYCFERILYIDPTHRAARKGLRIFNDKKRAQSDQLHHTTPFMRLFRGAGA